MKKYYTLWKSNVFNTVEDAILIKDQPWFKIKRHAFRRANKLARKLVYDRGDTILVRLIFMDNGVPRENVVEWEFRAVPN